MDIQIETLARVIIDGKPVGCIADAFANYPDQASEIYDAAAGWESALLQELQTARDAVAAAGERADKLVAELTAAAEADKLAALEAVRRDAQAIVDRFTGENAQLSAACQSLEESCRKSATEAQYQTDLQKHHWDLSQRLMRNESEAAVATLREIRRLEIAKLRARVDAEVAALEES